MSDAPPNGTSFDGAGSSLAAPRELRADVLSRQLRDAITSGALRPGQRIRQEDISRQYGTSRLPVRQALKQLESEGLVNLIPHAGARVASLDLAELEEVYQIRELLEPYAISKSVPNLMDHHLHQLRELVRSMEADPTARAHVEWLDLDRRFHLTTFAGAGLPRLMRLIEGFWNTTQQYRRAYTLLPQRLELAHAEHRLLLDAMESRDAVGAQQILQVHIRRTRLTLSEHSELFSSG